ncbi:MAG: hypothetical protein IEMM0006_1707 [bacterium]|nr:MAG: hypothetical protein IEMM0006_1707 [bacterium]
MKRFIFSVLIFSLAVTQLTAQSTFKNRLSIGLEVGPQFSGLRNATGLRNLKGRISANAGAYVQYDVSKRLKVSLGAYYDPRGFRSDYKSEFLRLSDTGYVGSNSYFAYATAYKINYLTFPVNVTYLSGGDKFRLLVQGGIYLSVALKYREKGFREIYINQVDLPHFGDSTLTAGLHRIDYDGSAKELFNATDFGLRFAFGMIYQYNKNIAFTFKPGFYFGLTRFFSNPQANVKWDRILRLNAGIVYKLHPYTKPKNEYILR